VGERWSGGQAAAALALAGAIALGAGCAAASNGLVAEGKRLFQEQGCYGCHTVGASGTPIATDLSRIGARYARRDLEAWLRDPRQQRPTAHMPRIELQPDEARALAAYLATLR
jgi:cytochrome c oxidase subunit 2